MFQCTPASGAVQVQEQKLMVSQESRSSNKFVVMRKVMMNSVPQVREFQADGVKQG